VLYGHDLYTQYADSLYFHVSRAMLTVCCSTTRERSLDHSRREGFECRERRYDQGDLRSCQSGCRALARRLRRFSRPHVRYPLTP
jgi:hypothetical protein